MCPCKGNLPAEYELMHQLIVYQVGKWSKIIMSNNLSLTTLNPDKLRPNASVQSNLPPEYELVHQFTVHQVGKRSKIIISNNLSLTTLNPDKARSNVSVQRQLTS